MDTRKLTALVLEDEMFIAMDLEQMLFAAGYDEVVALPTIEQAMQWLENNTPAIAVIDFHIRQQTCAPVAERLSARAVPTVIHSGNKFESGYHGEFFVSFPWLSKPTTDHALRVAIDEAKARAGSDAP